LPCRMRRRTVLGHASSPLPCGARNASLMPLGIPRSPFSLQASATRRLHGNELDEDGRLSVGEREAFRRTAPPHENENHV
jgi:hypothetical protein